MKKYEVLVSFDRRLDLKFEINLNIEENYIVSYVEQVLTLHGYSGMTSYKITEIIKL